MLNQYPRDTHNIDIVVQIVDVNENDDLLQVLNYSEILIVQNLIISI